MMSEVKLVMRKDIFRCLTAFALLLGFFSDSFAGESSQRAVANAAGFHLTALDVKPPATEHWIVSGFAPGVGWFSQSVGNKDININYKEGTASLITIVTTSLGLTIPINVTWNATSSQITQTVPIPNPSRTLTNNFKRASVSGTVGAFTIGVGVTGSIDQRAITP
ncbi:MAG: hypothetical protein HYY47_03045 [Deltaproteobacteria bacterium]|nr:hypothetical protein [Deltaproteobacteria bacterium]